MVNFKKIDLNTFPRKDHFNYFKTMSFPFVGTTCNVDVTDLVKLCKERKLSFYLLFMHATALAADDINELRQRILNDEIVEYDECPTSHTEPLEDGTYCYCTLYHHMQLHEYLDIALKQQQACKISGSIKESEDVNSMYFVSCVPWVNYTGLIQPVASNKDSNPRIVWGKFVEENGKYSIPLTIQAHHGLVDGRHIGMFYDNVNNYLKEIVKEI